MSDSPWIFIFFKPSSKGRPAQSRSDMRRQDSAKSAQGTCSTWIHIYLLQAVIQGSACCTHWTRQTCADKIQLEVRSVQALPEHFSSSSVHLKADMLSTLNQSDMRRQDSARSAQCQTLPEYLSSSSLHPKVGLHRAGQTCADNIQLKVRRVHALPEYIFLFFKHSFKGRHAAYTEPVRHAQTRFS